MSDRSDVEAWINALRVTPRSKTVLRALLGEAKLDVDGDWTAEMTLETLAGASGLYPAVVKVELIDLTRRGHLVRDVRVEAGKRVEGPIVLMYEEDVRG